MSKNTPVLSVREAAHALGCTINYIFQLLWSERLVGASKPKNKWRIPVSAIETYKKEQLAREGR